MALKKRSRAGGISLPTAERRSHCISVRCNSNELATVDGRRGSLQRGKWLRTAALGTLPAFVPELNQDAWIALSRAAANINQIAAHINQNRLDGAAVALREIEDVRQRLHDFRRALLGDFDQESGA